jgi:hypothetical protein
MTRNSGVRRGVTLAVFTSMIALTGGLVNPASAADPPLPAPVASDLCGVSKDRAYLSNDADPTTDVSWVDSTGVYYAAGEWNSTDQASSLTLTVKIWGASGLTTYTYAPITFGVEPDSSCAQALDTVSVSGMTCMSNGGTRATFTYVNTPDIGWPQTFVTMFADRWDSGQSASFNFTNEGETVPEGGSVSVTGGDTLYIKTEKEFFLAPGTYRMWVQTVESGQRQLSNTFFVPACGGYKVPPGDPSGQGGQTGTGDGTATKPKGFLKQVSPYKVKVKVVNKGVGRKTKVKAVINPVKGKTVVKSFKVAAGKAKARKYPASPRAKVVLKARYLVDDGNGRLVNKWKVLKRLKLKAR